MNQYLAAALAGAACTVAIEVVAAAWAVKSPNVKSWRWWAAWTTVAVCAQIWVLLSGVAHK